MVEVADEVDPVLGVGIVEVERLRASDKTPEVDGIDLAASPDVVSVTDTLFGWLYTASPMLSSTTSYAAPA